MTQGFRVKCPKCGCEYDSRVPEPLYCSRCHASMPPQASDGSEVRQGQPWAERRGEVWRANSRRYYWEHREERRRYRSFWGLLHPDASKHYRANRRARLKNAGGAFTPEEFGLKCLEADSRCVYCGEVTELVPDHAVPLSRGGDNLIGNILPSCVRCNRQKGSKTYEEFVLLRNGL